MTRPADPPMVVRTLQATERVRINAAFEELVGLPADALRQHELVHWIHPQDRWRLQSAVVDGGGSLEARHRTADGSWVTVAWEVRAEDGDLVVLGRCPGGERAPARADGAPPNTSASSGLAVTLRGMADIVEARNPGLRCSILLVTSCGSRVSVGAGPSLPDDYNEAVEGLRIGPMVGSCGTAAYWGVPVVVEHIEKDPLWADLREAAALAGVSACWSTPIFSTAGEILGAMALYADEPTAPTVAQMDSLEIAAHMVGFAVERDLLEQQLRESEKMEAVGRLAGGVAHNFNNLLTVMLGHLELLREKGDRPPDPATLDTIERAVTTASEMTGQLLAFGRRGEHGGARADLVDALHELARVLDPLIGDHISVSIETDPSLRWITVDRGHLGQIMLNLLLNAREAMAAGGHIRIETRPATIREVGAAKAPLPASRYVAVSVSDTGPGMDAATRERAFEPFFTTKGERGTGLGLATVYALTTQSGGHAFIESELGRGTTITLLFPQGDPLDVSVVERSGGATSIASVLVAEDNQEIRRLVARVLDDAGYDVVEARNGQEAWALCEDGLAPDLLVTDIMMPRMDGVELARRVRGRYGDTRVVYISGHAFDRIAKLDADPTHEVHLAKPFSPGQLRESVLRALALPGGPGMSPSRVLRGSLH